MTVLSTKKDAEKLTMTLIAHFEASPERVWTVWEDPRQLELWWGPPTYPATFTRHDFVVGGESRYFMTGPSGDHSYGWWRMDLIDRPRRLEFANGLASHNGEPMPDFEPMAGHVSFENTERGTLMTVVTRFVSAEQMEMMLGMGMEEGMTAAIGQIDALVSSASV